MNWSEIKNFKPEEFDSPDILGSGEIFMSLEFMYLLDKLRTRVDQPLRINSGYRTQAHHDKIYKDHLPAPNSAHLRGLAADISCEDSKLRYLILKNAFQLNFNRIEVAPHHIHLDIDPSLPQDVVIFLEKY